MKIEVWYDIACPYCYIGLKHLEKAFKQYSGEQPNVVLRSFELEPEIAVDCGETQYTTLIRQYKLSPIRARQTLDAIVAVGRAAGLTFDFDKVICTNTFNAHRLVHFAGKDGRGLEMNKRLSEAYFEEGRHIGRKNELVYLAADLGIDAGKVMDGNLYAADVRNDEHKSQYMGVSKIPFFLFNDKYSMTGAQPVSAVIEFMNRIGANDVKL